ncbi:hypothetical protein [Lacrimispora indolis]|uniref:hypothetical protein n=1 Tax=Lacrimispora indolis TaxID=69825 RepID=UPI00045E70E9|nr:hypothetical protein [Lacrimispora indolis]
MIIVMEQHLLEFWRNIGEKISILSEAERERIWMAVKEKYLRPNVRIGYSIFDAVVFSSMVGIDVPDSWRWIGDFIKSDSIILFFNKDMGNNFYEIENGSKFVEFYDECGVIEFYITDRDANYLLGYNHSQCLFTMGTACEWLENDKRYKARYPK